MRRRRGVEQDAAAVSRQAVEHRLHVFLVRDVMRDREGAGRHQLALHVALQLFCQPGAEHEAVHLIEDDVGLLEDRLPAEAVGIEAARPRDVGHGESDTGDLLLHLFRSSESRDIE